MSEFKEQPNRRRFLKNASGIILGSALVSMPQLSEAVSIPEWKGDNSDKYWKNVRKLFPLQKNVRFMNNGTMGVVPASTLKRMNESLELTYSKGKYGGGKAELVKALAKFINANEDEIALTHNVTEGNSIVCWGLPLKEGDEVIITDQEHVGNALTWMNRAKVHGIKLKPIKILTSPEEIIDNFKKAISSKTRAITIPHIPCTTGQVNPIKEICEIAREKGIYTIIDGAHGPGMIKVDVKDLGCDAYVSCGHKWMLGPAGTGFFYVKKDILEEVQTLFVGAGAEGKEGWDIYNPLGDYKNSANRYYYGTQSAALYHGFLESINLLNEIGLDRVEQRCKQLANRLYENLKECNDCVDMLSQENPKYRAGIVSFKFKDQDNRKFMVGLRDYNAVIRHVPESGLDSLRVSTHIYNSEEDVDYLSREIKDYMNG
jgi:cysteine desulfurase/selenocysteine lyase